MSDKEPADWCGWCGCDFTPDQPIREITFTDPSGSVVGRYHEGIVPGVPRCTGCSSCAAITRLAGR